MTYIKPDKGPFPPEADQGRSRTWMDQPKPAQERRSTCGFCCRVLADAADDTALRNSISNKMDDEDLPIGVQAVVFRILREVGVLK